MPQKRSLPNLILAKPSSVHPVIIRQAGPQDQPAVSFLESLLKTRAEPDYAARLFASSRAVFIAWLDHHPVGYVVLNPAPAYSLFMRLNMPELQDLNVLPDHRNKGVGAALVAVCEGYARGLGHTHIGLAVGLDKTYGPAQRLYVRLGYMPDGFGVTYDRAPITPGEMRPVDDNLCLMMVKDLS